MGLFKHFLFPFVLLSATVTGLGQHYTLNGHIQVKNGENYPYQLAFIATGTAIHGQSLTKLPGGLTARISIDGQLNREKRSLTFSEKKLIGDLPEHLSMCLVEAVLTYKPQNARFPLSGNFLGKDNANKFCGEGVIELESSRDMDDLFNIVVASHRNFVVDTELNPQAGEFEITSGVAKQFQWKADTCLLEIYDGGFVDGDIVTIMLNDKEILVNYVLTKQKRALKLPLKKGLNTISIIAGYEGSMPPNTANITVSDGNKKYQIKAFNNSGDKANILLDRN